MTVQEERRVEVALNHCVVGAEKKSRHGRLQCCRLRRSAMLLSCSLEQSRETRSVVLHIPVTRVSDVVWGVVKLTSSLPPPPTLINLIINPRCEETESAVLQDL